MKQRKWFLGVIIFSSIILRCFYLEERTIHYDDAFSILLSSESFSSIVKGTAADTMPPLYYFLLHIWMLISSRIWWLRLSSVLLSLLGIYFLYLIIKHITNEESAIWAAFISAISPIQIYHAQDLRMYALLQFAQLGYAYCFLMIWGEADTNPKFSRYWLGFIFFGMISMYTHNLAILILIIPDIFLIMRKEWHLLKRLIVSQLIIGVLAIPWLIFVPGQVEKIQTAFSRSRTL